MINSKGNTSMGGGGGNGKTEYKDPTDEVKKRCLALILIVFFVVGCTFSMQGLRDQAVSFAESDVKNVAAMKQVSDTLKKTWNFYSGALDGIQDQLSRESLAKKEALDKLYASEQWDDRASGEALVLRGRLVYELGRQGVDEILPGFLKLLGPLL